MTATSSAAPSSTRWRCRPTSSSGRGVAAARSRPSASCRAMSPTSPTSAGQVRIAVESADPGARPHHVLLRRRQPRRRPVEGDDRMDPRQPRLRRPRAGLLDAAGLLRRRSPAQRDRLPRRHHRAAALLSRLLQRHARHQARPAPRRGATRPGRARRRGARRRRRRARREHSRADRRGLGRSPLHRVPRHPHRHLDPVGLGLASAPCRAAPASSARRSSSTATRRWSYRTLPRVNEHQVVVAQHRRRPVSGFVEAEPYLDFDDWRERWLSRRGGAAGSLPGGPARLQPADPAHPFRGRGRRRRAAASSRSCTAARRRRPTCRPSTCRHRRDALVQRPSCRSRSASGGIGADRDRRHASSSDPAACGLHLRRDTTDTWTFHTDRWEEPVEATLGGDDWRVEESGPLRGAGAARRPPRHLAVRLDRQPLPRRAAAAPRPRGQFRRALHASADADRARRRRPSAGPTASPAATSTAPLGPTEWPFLGWSRLPRRRQPTSALVTSRLPTATASTARSGSRRCCAARGWPGAAASRRPMPGATSTPTRASTASPSCSASAAASDRGGAGRLPPAARRSRWSSSTATRA